MKYRKKPVVIEALKFDYEEFVYKRHDAYPMVDGEDYGNGMTAQEMFEVLGFELMPSNFMWVASYKLKNNDTISTIQINFRITGTCHVELREDGYEIGAAGISPSLLKAIHQQMKELGWLDEE